MARKREGTVLESLEEILALCDHYAGSAAARRLRMLEILAGDSPVTFSAVAATVGRSERTVRRWWKTYEHAGIHQLIGCDRRARGVESLHDDGDVGAPSIPNNVARFLNELPTCCDAVEWLTALRTALLKLLPDVDVVTVAVDVHCDVVERSGGESAIVVTQRGSSDCGRKGRSDVSSSVSNRRTSEQIIDEMGRGGFALKEYHPPAAFDYYLNRCAYVGSIVLWCRRSRLPLSRTSREAMRLLEPFMSFLLSDCIARQQLVQKEKAPFSRVVDAIGDQIGLTVRQKQVFLLQLLGLSYAEIGRRLHICETTVSHHVQFIHEKAGTHSYTELFARFFTPLRGT